MGDASRPGDGHGAQRPLQFMRSWLIQTHFDGELQRKAFRVLSRNVMDNNSTDNRSKESVSSQPPSYADFVISFRFAAPSKAGRNASEEAAGEARSREEQCRRAMEAFVELVRRLQRAGLDVEVREALDIEVGTGPGSGQARARQAHYVARDGELLIFVTCPQRRLLRELTHSRIHDWLNGLRVDGDGEDAVETVIPAISAAEDTPTISLSARSAGLRQRRGGARFGGRSGSKTTALSELVSPLDSGDVDDSLGLELTTESELDDDIGCGTSSDIPSLGRDHKAEGDDDGDDNGGNDYGETAKASLQMFNISALTLDRISPAERIRLVYHIITGPENERCAGINPDNEPWIHAILPLHDRRFNKQWIKRWSVKWLIDYTDLNSIRTHFGEEIAMYFAFLQNYFLWLIAPTVLGVLTYIRGVAFSWGFGVLIVAWSLFLTEVWERRQKDLASFWGTKGVSEAEEGWRPSFRPDRWVADPVTGRPTPYFSNSKRWARRLVGFPILLLAAAAMAALVSFMFALQTFFEEYYEGPFQAPLVYLPTIMYSACVPLFTAVCRKVARRLNDYENYGRESEYVAQYMTKIFVFQFLQDQLYLILTAWVFIPYRDKFEVWLRSLYDLVLASEHSLRFVTGPDGKHLYHIKKSDTPAAEKLESLLLYFVVTGQIINLAFETVIPMVMRYFTDRKQARAKVLLPEQQQEKDGRHSTMETKAAAAEDNSLAKHRSSSSSSSNDKSVTKRSAISHIASLTDLYISSSDNEDEAEGDGSSVKKIDHTTPATVYDTVLAKIDTLANSPLHEQKFVARVTSEVDLPSYDLYEDYAEMVSQFGYVTFFSIIWPFAPLCAFINNWIELRSDAVKICLTVRRPLPVRAETIGPWLDAMRATSWLASISNALLVYQFNGTASWLPSTDKESMTRYGRTDLVVALVIMIFAEHLFLVVRMLVRRVLASWPCAADRRNEMAKAKMKQKWWRKLSRVLQDEEKAEEVADVTGGGTRVDFDQQVQFGSQVICNAFKIR